MVCLKVSSLYKIPTLLSNGTSLLGPYMPILKSKSIISQTLLVFYQTLLPTIRYPLNINIGQVLTFSRQPLTVNQRCSG